MGHLLDKIIDSAKEDLKERIQDGCDDASDEIHEIADNHVPVYNAKLMELFFEDPNLCYAEPEIGHGTAGNNMIGMAQAIIYEEIQNALYADLDDLKEAVRVEGILSNLLPVGTSVEDGDGRPGKIVQVDEEDADAPYLVLFDDEDEDWMSPDDIDVV